MDGEVKSAHTDQRTVIICLIFNLKHFVVRDLSRSPELVSFLWLSGLIREFFSSIELTISADKGSEESTSILFLGKENWISKLARLGVSLLGLNVSSCRTATHSI